MNFNTHIEGYELILIIAISIVGYLVTYVNGKIVQSHIILEQRNTLESILSIIAFFIGLSFHVWLFLKVAWYAPILSFMFGFFIFTMIVMMNIGGRDGFRNFIFGFAIKYISIFEIIVAIMTLILWFAN